MFSSLEQVLTLLTISQFYFIYFNNIPSSPTKQKTSITWETAVRSCFYHPESQAACPRDGESSCMEQLSLSVVLICYAPYADHMYCTDNAVM